MVLGDFRRFSTLFGFFFNSYCSKEVVVAYHTNKTKLSPKSGFPGKNLDFFISYRSKEVVVAAYHTNNPTIKRNCRQNPDFPGKNSGFFQFLLFEGGGVGGISYQ